MEITIILSTIIFLFICIGIGYAALLLTKPKPIIDSIFLSLAVGLALLPIIILLLRIAHLPLDIRLLIFLSAIGPAIGIITARKPQGAVSLKRYLAIAFTVVAAALITSLLYVGATHYPYLEDDDPWGHAAGAHYVALEKTTAGAIDSAGRYLEPYPPYYTALMGMLHQTNKDLQWVLKFFNAVIIGISIIAAFYAFEVFSGDAVKAAAAAIILGMLPAYMSHFIWSQTLAIPTFLIALWAIARLEPVKNWKQLHTHDGFLLAALLVWSATIIQPSTAAVFAMLFVIYGIIIAAIGWFDRNSIAYTPMLAIIAGGVLSFLTWLGFALVYGWAKLNEQIGISTSLGANDTSGGVIYSLKDIIFAPMSSKIDQATGLGWLVCIFVLVALIAFILNWRKLLTTKNAMRAAMIAWLIFCLIGIEGNALPFKLFPHRFWVLLAIPVAYLCAEGIMLLANLMKRESLKFAAVAVLTILVVLTSFGPRVAVQQAIWPPGVGWTGNEELSTYIQMKQQLPVQTRIFSLCADDAHLIGMNMDSRPWERDMQLMKADLENLTGDRIASFMHTYNYEYVVLDSSCVQKLGANATENLGRSMSETKLFTQLQLPNPQRGIIIAKIS